jgi:hypothetical protein
MPEILKQIIQSEKCLISIILGSTGIKSLLSVPKGMKHNTTFFIESVVPDSVEHICQESQRETSRGIVVHLDNARPHSRKSQAALTATTARRIPAPIYSPYLSPSKFFLFGMPKERVSRTACNSPYELISAVSELITPLPKYQLVSDYKTE